MESRKGKESFSAKAKDELVRIPLKNKREMLAEIAAFIRLTGTLRLNQGISFEVESPTLARRIFAHIKVLYGYCGQISMKRFRRLGKQHKYYIMIDDPDICQKLLYDTYYLTPGYGFAITPGMHKAFYKKESLCRCFFRVIFLTCGSCTDPEKNYHLELVLADERLCRELQKVLRERGLNAKIVLRKQAYVLYLKDAENISDFLTFIGAHAAILAFFNVKIIKEMRNQVNRTVNCETANIQKTVNAAGRQLKSIAAIQRKVGLSSLPDELREAAELRLAHPDMSLSELCGLCQGKISKSGLNHRFRKLDDLAGE